MLGPLAGGLAGAGAGGSLGALGGLFDLLKPLDYPRQALWNVPSSLAKGDYLGALPGLLGAGAGLGLAATGLGLPAALLGGSLAGGISQGIGRSTGGESFDAPTPSALLDALGGDSSTLPGMIGAGALGIAGDPLTWTGLAAGRNFGKGAQVGRDVAMDSGLTEDMLRQADQQSHNALLESMKGLPTSAEEQAFPVTSLAKLTGRFPESIDAQVGAMKAGATPQQIERAAGAGYAGRNKNLADLTVEQANRPVGGEPISEVPKMSRTAHRQMSQQNRLASRGALNDYLSEFEQQVNPFEIETPPPATPSGIIMGGGYDPNKIMGMLKGADLNPTMQMNETQFLRYRLRQLMQNLGDQNNQALNQIANQGGTLAPGFNEQGLLSPEKNDLLQALYQLFPNQLMVHGG
jgi:hypothetical protein